MGIRGIHETPAVNAAVAGFADVLGTSPQGASPTVAARLSAIEIAAASVESSLTARIDDLVGTRDTIALLGDSITGQNTGDGGAANNAFHQAVGYFTWANIYLGQRFTLVQNGNQLTEFGGSGMSVQTMISGGQLAAAVASGADWLLVHGGTNDLATRTAVQIAADLQTCWDTAIAAGMRVIATTILPRDAAGDTQATWDKVRDTNALIRTNARATRGVTLVDWYSAIVDPTTGKGSSTYLADGVHPNVNGANRMGKVLADALGRAGYDINSVLPNDAYDPKSLMPNPFMLGNTAGVATSTTFYNLGSGTSVKSKVARTDGQAGEWQQFVITAAAPTADGAQVQQQNTAVGVDWNVGDVVYGICEIETDAASWDVRSCFLEIVWFGTTGSLVAARVSSAERAAVTQALIRPADRVVLLTPRLAVPTGTTRLQLNLYVYGPGTVRLGRFDVRKV